MVKNAREDKLYKNAEKYLRKKELEANEEKQR